MITKEIKADIDMLAEVVSDPAAIAKAMQRKHGVKVSMVRVRDYLEQRAYERKRAAALARAKEKQAKIEATVVSPDALPVDSIFTSKAVTAAEVGSKMLLASICRLAFKQGKLLPHLTYAEQLERARADGFSGHIQGAL